MLLEAARNDAQWRRIVPSGTPPKKGPTNGVDHMNDAMQDKGRITTRVPLGVLEKLQEAADLTGATVNQFVVQSALEKAEEVIDRERVISLSGRDAVMLLTMLDNPTQPNKALLSAFERYKKKVADGNINTSARPAT
jgi:uncharacterized protein (DUF1778 family)